MLLSKLLKPLRGCEIRAQTREKELRDQYEGFMFSKRKLRLKI